MTASSCSPGPPGGDVPWTPNRMLEFAEVLYKCTLCTSLPSILTSTESFTCHVYDVHLGGSKAGQSCDKCGLKFSTAEDLHAHASSHPTSHSSDKPSANGASHSELAEYSSPSLGLSTNDMGLRPSSSSALALQASPNPRTSSPSSQSFGLLAVQTDNLNLRNSSKFQSNVTSAHFHEQLKEHRQRELFEQKYGKYATTLNICGQIFCFCKACSLKFDNEYESRDHFESSAHKNRVEEYDQWKTKKTQNALEYPLASRGRSASPVIGSTASSAAGQAKYYSQSISDIKLEAVGSSRSKRKRMLPLPCRQNNASDLDSGSELDEAISAPFSSSLNSPGGPDKENTRSSHTQKYSLMQSDRKRLSAPSHDKPNKCVKYEHDNSNNDGDTESLGDVTDGSGSDVSMTAAVKNGTRSSAAVHCENLTNGISVTGNHGDNDALSSLSSALHKNMDKSNSYFMPIQAQTALSPGIPGPWVSAVSPHVEETTSLSCPQCAEEFTNLNVFNSHFRERHMATPPTYTTMQYKVVGIKTVLPQHITQSSKEHAFIPREEIMSRLGDQLDMTEAAMWGPACNKAMRELFPGSSALRKGKHKKTYYYGVEWMDGTHCEEDVDTAEDMAAEQQTPSANSVRSLGPDVQVLLQNMPDLIRWTGQFQQGCQRDTLLQTLSSRLANPDILQWGQECNRAVRYLFPDTVIRRRGKYKSTCYYGIEMAAANRGTSSPPPAPQTASPPPPATPKPSSGPPVVNARDIMDKPAPSPFSRLPPSHAWSKNPILSGSSSRSSPVHSAAKELVKSYSYTEKGLDLSAKARNSDSGGKNDTSSKSATVTESHTRVFNSSTPTTINSNGSSPQQFSVVSSSSEVISAASLASLVSSHYAALWPPAVTSSLPRALDSYAWPLGGIPAHTELEKRILLHPGPFVTARIISRRHQRLVPNVNTAVLAMQMLQGRGLGQTFTMKQGNSKVFFKAIPSESLKMPLAALEVELGDYKDKYSERDSKLETNLHERLKAFCPYGDQLKVFYKH